MFARFALVMLVTLSACAGAPSNDWDDIDYSSVYRRAVARENDDRYIPTVTSCIDEDLYNCE